MRKIHISGGIWKTRPVVEQAQMTLARWQVFEIASANNLPPTRHFVGWNVFDREGRVSSAIKDFDTETMRGRTKSGRIYELVGEPGSDPDAAYVWHRWLKINGSPEFRDITSELAQTPKKSPSP